MQDEIIKTVVSNIDKNSRFLITSHINPDGDSLGSQLALYHILRQCDKHVRMVNADSVPDTYRFLPGSSHITSKMGSKNKFDTVFVLDCSASSRTGSLEKWFSKLHVPLINIDHHSDNNYFGDINWVDPGASSVGEMIFHLLEAAGLKLTKEISVCLYTAILTDTGSFNYDNTTARTYSIASQLVESGIRPEEIARRIYQNQTVSSLRLLGYVLSDLQLTNQGRLCWSKVTPDMLKKADAEPEDTDEFIDYLRSIGGVEVAAFFQQDKSGNKVRVNFRSKGKINVSNIAHKFGGGGHPRASGCIISGALDKVIERVLKEVRMYL